MVFDLPESVSINDAMGFPLAAIGAVVATGIGTVSLFGTNLADPVTEIGMSIGAVLYLISFVTAWVTNDREMSEFNSGNGETERLLVFGAPALLVAHEYVTQISSAVTGSAFLGATVAVVLVGAYGLVAHY